VERRRRLLEAAVGRRPGDLGLLMTLGGTYPANQREGADEQVRWYQAAVAAAPANAAAHNGLGVALRDKKDLAGAEAAFRKAIELDPKLAMAHSNLGVALGDMGRVDEAIARYRKAIALDPKLANAHSNLGEALRGKGKVEEAIACCKKAIALDAKHATAHGALGSALADKGQVDEAIACYHKAIALDAKHATAHGALGSALARKGQVDEAIACYHKAIALDPKYAGAHTNLGVILCDVKRDYDGAIACFEKALELVPNSALCRSNLGHALYGKGRLDEAIACYHKAIALDPKHPGARAGLARAERLATARDRFTAFRNGSYTPTSNQERLGMAEWCQFKKLHHTATGLYAAAFAADPRLTDDLGAAHRYNAACYAALAAAGKGADTTKLDDTAKARLRKQARDWLRADLALRTRQLESGQPADRAAVQQALRHWQKDRDLAGLRDKAALDKLPAQEQKAFARLWADVAALLKKAQKQAK
jgi:superkiller protein 3